MAGGLRLYALCGILYFYQNDRTSWRHTFGALYGDNGTWNDLRQLRYFKLTVDG